MKILPLLIKTDQLGFTPDRQSTGAMRRMINAIYYAKFAKIPSLMLSINAEKAFDHVHWSYMCHTLKKFGFCGLMYQAIHALHSNPSAQLYTSEMLSRPFIITNWYPPGMSPPSPTIQLQ